MVGPSNLSSILNIIISILIIALSGMIIYIYRRINILETSIIEHGKILQSFIINYNNQMLKATNNENSYNVTDYNDENKKIIVSDDEDIEHENGDDKDNNDNDSDDSGDGDDSDDSDDSDSEDDDVYDKSSKNNNNIKDDGINELEIIKLTDEKDQTYLDDLLDSNMNLDGFIDDSIFDEDKSRKLKMIKLDTNLENNLETREEKVSLSKMRVDELRTLAVTNNKIDNESAQKMKKNELLKLIKE